MSDNKNREIFYGVVAIATLIVAIIGATLAYFSITIGSTNEAVSAKAAIVQVDYSDGQQISASATELIPATFEVVESAYENINMEGDNTKNLCLDANDKEVCSVYRFTIGNGGEGEIDVFATLNTDLNGFSYLSYAVRDVDKGEWVTLSGSIDKYKALASCSNDGDKKCYTEASNVRTYNDGTSGAQSIYSLFGTSNGATQKVAKETPRTFDIVLFIEENNGPQNIDQGKEYKGTIIVDIPNQGQITGKKIQK